VLAHLASCLTSESGLRLRKEVYNIQPLGDRVRVHCVDGSYFDGDLVVGADGVHSKVRREMWRLAKDIEDPKFSSIEKKSQSPVRAKYLCGTC